MTSIPVSPPFETRLAELLRRIRPALMPLLRRLIAAIIGKRGLAALGSLLAPDPTITKLLAIGFAIWLIWDIIDAHSLISEMTEWIQQQYQSILIAVIDEASALGRWPPEDQRSVWECLAVALERFASNVGAIGAAAMNGAGQAARDQLLRDVRRCILGS